MKPKIAILTSFTGCDSAYSLVNVVRTQLRMLLDAGYDPALIVSENFTETDPFWNGRRFRVIQAGKPDEKAETLIVKLRPILAEFDLVFCHDIVLLSQNREYGDAVRALSKELEHTAWLHWQHSRGGHSPIEPFYIF